MRKITSDGKRSLTFALVLTTHKWEFEEKKQKLTLWMNKISEARDSEISFGFYELNAINCVFFIWIDLQMQVIFLWSTEKKNIISFKPSDTFLWQKNKICPRTKIREKKTHYAAQIIWNVQWNACSLFEWTVLFCWMAVRVKQLSSLISNCKSICSHQRYRQ